MKSKSTQQEVLLLTGTSFSNRQQWCANDDNKAKKLSEEEQLEEACWNGLLPQLLPEIFIEAGDSSKLYLWQVKEAAAFLELELGEYPEKKDNYFSIDPYSFLAFRCSN